jgi:hypothetical protein
MDADSLELINDNLIILGGKIRQNSKNIEILIKKVEIMQKKLVALEILTAKER